MKRKQEKEKKKQQKTEENEKMWELFREIWNERPHYSELSWIWLGREISSIFFHHILPKSKYKDAKFDKDNIILITGDEHSTVENNPTKYGEINDRREKLKKKYG